MADFCETPGCGKPASMACPTCIKLGLQRSYYCSQDCFKSHWPVHKARHKHTTTNGERRTTLTADGMPIAFERYNFTGTLRPHLVTPRRPMPPDIWRPDYADHPKGVSKLEQEESKTSPIPVYTTEQIAGIRRACQVGREVLDEAGRAVRAGVTCDEIDRIVHEACIVRGAYPSPLNYYNFPKSVCTSVNEVICHGIPDIRPLENGDIVNIDVTTYVGGYHGDLNETFFVGEVDAESRRLVETAFNCLAAALAQVKPGAMYRDLGNVISKVARENSCQVVRTYCGHGIGSLFHTVPNVPHYSKNKAKGIMKPGHIFTVEPMITLGTYQDVLWPDDWSAVTADGKRSAQFEHTVLVTEQGCEILTCRQDEPVMRWDPALLQR